MGLFSSSVEGEDVKMAGMLCGTLWDCATDQRCQLCCEKVSASRACDSAC